MFDFLPSFIGSNYIYFLIWLVILIKGADILVSGASSLAKKFGISPLVVWLTIVAFGTSAPELFVNILSAFKWQTDLALGNIIGSNIANTLLVLWAGAAVYPLTAKSSTIYKEVPFSLLVSFVLFFFSFDTIISWQSENIIVRWESFVLLLFFIIFFVYTFGIAKVESEQEENDEIQEKSVTGSLVFILVWLVMLSFGADILVGSASNIALSFWVSEAIIGLTIVAVGTSAPELVTSIVAAKKKQTDIAIGNVVGSNIFNILFVLGVTGSIANLPVSKSMMVDMWVEIMVIFLLLLFLFFFGKRGVLTRKEGILFIFLYFSYIAYLIFSQVA